jgi:SAM-dependent methyltransferase
MDALDLSDFAPRSCPHCGSARKAPLLEVPAEDIINSNWSYRPGAANAMKRSAEHRFPIVQCKACDFIYAGLLPGAVFTDRLYDVVIDSAAARATNLSRGSLAQKMGDLSALFRVVPPGTEPIRLLDYGCGFGPALEILRNLPGVNALGYETSAVRLRDLAKRGLSATGDISRVSKEGPFNVVLLDNVLEHLPNPRQTLRFVREVCAPAAVLYVSVPSISGKMISAQHEAIRCGALLQMDINPWEHLNYFDLKHLDSLLRDFGLMPFSQSSFADQVNIGLRASRSLRARFKNAAASTLRLWRYVWAGTELQSVTRRFYRLEAK